MNAVVQKAVAGGSTGGRRGGARIQGQPAMVSIAGVIWRSEIPENAEQADFINKAAERATAEHPTSKV